MSDNVERLRGWRTVHLARLHLLMEEAADEIERLRLAIARLAEQDATLSVQGGNVIVEMDAKTPNDATPMAGSGPTVPANDRASDCSEDGRERASASFIGNTKEPAAWAVMRVGGGWRCIADNAKQAESIRRGWDKAENLVHEVVPLYRQPTLTDAERICISEVVHCLSLRQHAYLDPVASERTLRGLLARLGGDNAL